MGPFPVVFLDPRVERGPVRRHAAGHAPLDLPADVGVHPLVGPVLPQPAGLRPVRRDPEAHPPGAEGGEPEEAGRRGERRPVVAPDDLRQSEPREKALESLPDRRGGRRLHQPDLEYRPARQVSHGERQAPLAVRHPPSLEVDGPHVVGPLGRYKPPHGARRPGWRGAHPAGRDEARLAEDVCSNF